MWGRRQGAEVPTDGTETKEPLASHHHLQAQRKEVRGPVAPGGPTSESPLYASSQSSDRGRTPRAPPQRARLPEAMEPPRREAALLHNVNNQISQDGEPRTDSWYVISIYTCGPRGLPRDR